MDIFSIFKDVLTLKKDITVNNTKKRNNREKETDIYNSDELKKNIKCRIIRLYQVYGGANERSKRLWPALIKAAKNNDNFNMTSGNQIIDFNYIENVIAGLLEALDFNKKSKNLFQSYLIKNRHYMVSFIILVQNLKSVPKPIRINCNLYFLGKFASKYVILNDLYEEVSNVLTEEQFEELYTHATAEKYGSLVIDATTNEKRFYMGFEKELRIEN
jgi:hypothetical protein